MIPIECRQLCHSWPRGLCTGLRLYGTTRSERQVTSDTHADVCSTCSLSACFECHKLYRQCQSSELAQWPSRRGAAYLAGQTASSAGSQIYTPTPSAPASGMPFRGCAAGGQCAAAGVWPIVRGRCRRGGSRGIARSTRTAAIALAARSLDASSASALDCSAS